MRYENERFIEELSGGWEVDIRNSEWREAFWFGLKCKCGNTSSAIGVLYKEKEATKEGPARKEGQMLCGHTIPEKIQKKMLSGVIKLIRIRELYTLTKVELAFPEEPQLQKMIDNHEE